MKTEYPSLLSPGFHDLTLKELEKRFVEPFTNPQHRQDLLEKFNLLLESEIKSFGISFQVWIDGSFTTKNPNPDDIDIVFFAREDDLDCLPIAKQEQFYILFRANQDKIKDVYKCDIYFTPLGNDTWHIYWSKTFGYGRDKRPKGIARIFI